MHEVKPKAELVEHGSHIGNISRIYAGYRRCYSASDNAEVKALPSDMEAFISKMLKAERAHESPLEHASLTFHVTCSRACSHQLVRHRIASYSQQSQRYVRMDDLPVIVPPSVNADMAKSLAFALSISQVEEAYQAFLAKGIPAEDARYLLPNATATQVIVSMNFRSLRHFFAERCCNRAQWEIREVANQMLETCRNLYPCVFEDVGPHCMKLKHCPEAKPCGKQPWKKES